jgi:hypothetical protein
MRARLVLLGIFPAAWAACFSSNAATPPDGSPDTAFDASEMDAVTPPAEAEAAVDAPATSMDAPVEATPEAEAAVDAPTEAGPAPVVVTVVGALGPESGIAVVWSDASGAVVATTTTDAAGATSMSASGAMVTALLGTSSTPSLYTITGVQPGDALVIVDWTSLSQLPGGQGGTYFSNTVSFTSLPPSLPGATSSVQFLSGADCSSSYSTPLSLPAQLTLVAGASNGLEPTCVGVGPIGSSYGAAYPALVEADDANGSFLAFAFAKNNGFASVDDAGGLDVAIGGTWSTATTTQTLSEANPTVGEYPWSYYSEAANGVLVPLSTQPPPSGLDASTSASDTFYATHPGFADFVQTEVGNGVAGGWAMIATRAPVPTANGTTTMDVSQLDSIPIVSGMSVDATNAARPDITWTGTSSPLTTATALVANLSWNGTDSEGGFQNGNWTVVAAAGSQSDIQVPALPASLAEWVPLAGANFYPGVAIVEGGTAIPGYAQARAASGAFYPIVQTSCPGYFGPAIPALPADGTVMVSYAGGGCG